MATTPAIPAANAVDLHGLEQLRHRAANDDPAALAEAAVQFEALFIGLMLESARNARLGSGLLDGPQTDQYFKMMDQQVALELARSGGFGFGQLLTEELAPQGVRPGAELRPLSPRVPAGASPPPTVQGPPLHAAPTVTAEFPSGLPDSLAAFASVPALLGDAANATAAEQFVARFLGEARAAGAALGVEPRLLLAQAALETGWGSALETVGAPANNLFGIKAGSGWGGARAAQWTMEQGSGGLERRREEFRAYESAASSFADYVDLIANTPRYANALANASDAEAYAHALSAAGYATDPDYASKWLSIYRGERLGNALQGAAARPAAANERYANQ